MNIKITIPDEMLKPITLKELDKKFKLMSMFWFTFYILSSFAIILSFPVWIWFGWSIFWRMFLTSVIIYIVSRYIYSAIVYVKATYKTKLREKNLLID